MKNKVDVILCMDWNKERFLYGEMDKKVVKKIASYKTVCLLQERGPIYVNTKFIIYALIENEVESTNAFLGGKA